MIDFDRWLLEGKRDYQDPIDDYLQMLMEPNVDYELKLVYTKMYDLIESVMDSYFVVQINSMVDYHLLLWMI